LPTALPATLTATLLALSPSALLPSALLPGLRGNRFDGDR
jgi:hypothetical protein